MNPSEDLFSAGLSRFQAGDAAGAIELLRSAIRSDPGSALYHFHLGNLYWHEQLRAEAVSCFREAQRLDPKIAELPLRMGLDCAADGRLEEADGCLRLALLLSGRDGQASSLADLLEKAVDIAPDSADTASKLGIALCQADRLEKAAAIFEKLIAISPGDAQARNNLAVALNRCGLARCCGES